jgi:hypothetical protein
LNEYPKFLRKANRETPILAIHGYEDHLVRYTQLVHESTSLSFNDFFGILFQIPVEFARQSYDLLKQHGAMLEYKEDREMDNRLRYFIRHYGHIGN